METLSHTPEQEPQSPGSLIVVTGPSGSGKDTLVGGLLQQEGFDSELIVTYTSRPSREGEKEGVDYHFVSNEDFEDKISTGFFAEHVRYGGSYKGTPRKPFDEVLEGNNRIWRIDPSRAAQIEDFFAENFGDEIGAMLYGNTTVFYVGVPRLTLLKDRVKMRENETFNHEEFLSRIQEDWDIWCQYQDQFPNVLMNDGTPEQLVMQAMDIINE